MSDVIAKAMEQAKSLKNEREYRGTGLHARRQARKPITVEINGMIYSSRQNAEL